MADERRRFSNDDDEAQFYLGWLRDGTREQKVQARDRLSQIFEDRGMVEEATELLEGNARAGVRDRSIFTRLVDCYVSFDGPAVSGIAWTHEEGILRHANRRGARQSPRPDLSRP
jgi:hypothetical protein